MSEWIKGFISGVIATIIGFILTMLWDIYKSIRETKEREGRVLLAIKEDLNSNIVILSDNFDLISKELEYIKSGTSLVNPLVPLKTGFWELVKIYLPKKLVKEDILIKIRDIVRNSEHINEMIQSRENFRIHNMALTNFGAQLKKYDGIILEQMQNILDLIDQLSIPLGISKKDGKESANQKATL